MTALPRANRLKHRQDFSAVYQLGSRRSTAHLILRALKQSQLKDTSGNSQTAHIGSTQIGIAISQKVSKRSVVRNRIKRQIRAALRQYLPSFATGWKLVIVAKPTATQCTYEQFLQELKQLLISAEVMDGH